jgi:hypothetical protein
VAPPGNEEDELATPDEPDEPVVFGAGATVGPPVDAFEPEQADKMSAAETADSVSLETGEVRMCILTLPPQGSVPETFHKSRTVAPSWKKVS